MKESQRKTAASHRHVRVRQGLLFALSDVVDALVVPGKHNGERLRQSGAERDRVIASSCLYVKCFPAAAPSSTQGRQVASLIPPPTPHFKTTISAYFFFFFQILICHHICTYVISHPLMLTNRSSAALWMWKTSSRKRQRQVELCSASFHRDRAVASLFSTEWHRMKPTARTRNGNK